MSVNVVFNAQMCCMNIKKKWHQIYWAIIKPPLPQCLLQVDRGYF